MQKHKQKIQNVQKKKNTEWRGIAPAGETDKTGFKEFSQTAPFIRISEKPGGGGHVPVHTVAAVSLEPFFDGFINVFSTSDMA